MSATITIGDDRYARTDSAQTCDMLFLSGLSGSWHRDAPQQLVRRCAATATHTALGYHAPAYRCARCAVRTELGDPTFAVVEGVYECAGPEGDHGR